MTVLGPRTYQVSRSELPLTITIARRNTGESAATTVILGHIRVVKQGQAISTTTPNTSTDRDGTVMYRIEKPSATGALHVTQSIQGWFAATAPDQARFETTISTASGQSERTSIRKPGFNPSVANLKFQVS